MEQVQCAFSLNDTKQGKGCQLTASGKASDRSGGSGSRSGHLWTRPEVRKAEKVGGNPCETSRLRCFVSILQFTIVKK